LFGAAALYLSVTYNDHEFTRIGYYVNTEYPDFTNPMDQSDEEEINDEDLKDTEENEEMEDEREDEREDEKDEKDEKEVEEKKEKIQEKDVKKFEIPKDFSINKLTRNILTNKPRITTFPIKWE
jgi:hypothetical protein